MGDGLIFYQKKTKKGDSAQNCLISKTERGGRERRQKLGRRTHPSKKMEAKIKRNKRKKDGYVFVFKKHSEFRKF